MEALRKLWKRVDGKKGGKENKNINFPFDVAVLWPSPRRPPGIHFVGDGGGLFVECSGRLDKGDFEQKGNHWNSFLFVFQIAWQGLYVRSLLEVSLGWARGLNSFPFLMGFILGQPRGHADDPREFEDSGSEYRTISEMPP